MYHNLHNGGKGQIWNVHICLTLEKILVDSTLKINMYLFRKWRQFQVFAEEYQTDRQI